MLGAEAPSERVELRADLVGELVVEGGQVLLDLQELGAVGVLVDP